MTSFKMEDDNYKKLGQIYQLLKDHIDTKNCEKNVYFKAIISDNFDVNYKLPSNSLICQKNPEYSGNTVLHFLVEFYNPINDKFIDILIKRGGVDITIQNDSSYTPLLLAFLNGNNIDKLLHYHSSIKNYQNFHCKNGISHFHAACSTNHVNMINHFLALSNVDVNEQVDNDSPKFAGYTALHFAMRYCQPQTIKFLLSNGANLKIKDANGMTPLHLLIKTLMEDNCLKENDQMFEFLQDAVRNNLFCLPDDVGFDRLHLNCILGNYIYLEEGTDIDFPLNLESSFCPGYTLLHFAAHFHFDSIMFLLKRGANILAKDVNGITPFDICLRKFDLDYVILFLMEERLYRLSELKFSNGTNLLVALVAMNNYDTFDNYLEQNFDNVHTIMPFDAPIFPGYSLLHLAIVFDGPMSIILTRKVNFINHDANGMSPLHLAFRLMKIDAVTRILDHHHHNPRNSVDRYGLSHLHIACAVNNTEAVKLLLENGANPNLPTLCDFPWRLSSKHNLINAGSTPLHIAVHLSCTTNCDLVSVLLSFEADPHIPDSTGITPYYIALEYQCDTVFNRMLRSDKKFYRENMHEKLGLTRLQIACFVQDLTMVKKELAARVDVNKQINFCSTIWPGDTALHILCRKQLKSRDEFVELLLEYGADINLPNARNSTAVHVSKGKLFQISSFLLKDNLNLKNPRNNKGLSHFHLCCITNNLFFAEKYLKSGTNPNTPVDYFILLNAGYTPLHYAVKYGYLKLMELLLSYGADPNIKAADGFTPLLLAISLKTKNFDQMTILLRCHKVDVQAKNFAGVSVMELFLENYFVDERVLKILLDKGASIDFARLIIKKPNKRKILLKDIIRKRIFYEYFWQFIENIRNWTAVDDQDQNAIHHISSISISCHGCLQFYASMERFIDLGCNLYHKNRKGKTALHLAVSLRNIEMVKALLSLGMDINIKDDDKKTPFAYVSTKKSCLELRTILIQHAWKLKSFGLYVDEFNETLLNNRDFNKDSSEPTANFIKDLQISKLNSELKQKISPNFSVAYFFSDKFIKDYRKMSPSEHQAIYDIRNFNHLYRPLISLQFRTAEVRSRLLDSAANAISTLIVGLSVYDTCFKICEKLSNDDLMNLIRAVNNKL